VETGFTVAAAVWAIGLCLFVLRPTYIRAREYMSPKYAAARKVRQAKRNADANAASRRARENEEARLKQWATDHSDDPTAQAYLATLPAGPTEVAEADKSEDIEAVLRAEQESEDALQLRLARRRAAEARHLLWARQHPQNPVARRYLEKVLTEARQRAQYGPNKAEAMQTVADIEASLEYANSDQQ